MINVNRYILTRVGVLTFPRAFISSHVGLATSSHQHDCCVSLFSIDGTALLLSCKKNCLGTSLSCFGTSLSFPLSFLGSPFALGVAGSESSIETSKATRDPLSRFFSRRSGSRIVGSSIGSLLASSAGSVGPMLCLWVLAFRFNAKPSCASISCKDADFNSLFD
jgi:hypothetical protein